MRVRGWSIATDGGRRLARLVGAGAFGVALLVAMAACATNDADVVSDAAPQRSATPAECRPGVIPERAAGHQHLTDPAYDVVAVLDETQCALLQGQLALARRSAQRHPTVRDAERAGYQRLGYYAPGVAAHYVKPSIYDTRFDPAEPEFLLYDGIEPTSRIVGVSYAARQRAYPEMFIGPNDHSHRHAWCPPAAPGAEGREIGDPGCTERNAEGADEWLLHAWVVEGHASPYGVFSPTHPYLTADGWDPDHPVTPVDGVAMREARDAVEARLAAGGGPLVEHHGDGTGLADHTNGAGG